MEEKSVMIPSASNQGSSTVRWSQPPHSNP